MPKKVPVEDKAEWPPWMNIQNTPGPGHYDPVTLDTRIHTSISRRFDSAHETLGPGYDYYPENNTNGAKWRPPPPSKPSPRRGSFNKQKSTTSTLILPDDYETSKTVLDQKELSEGASAYPNDTLSLHYTKFPENLNENLNRQLDEHETRTKRQAPKLPNYHQSEKDVHVVTPPWPSPEMINTDSSLNLESNTIDIDLDQNSEKLSFDNNDVNYGGNDATIKSNPSFPNDQEISGLQTYEPHALRPSIFLTVPPNQSPFSWITDGKLSIFGCICAICVFILGIVHLSLWSKLGLCIFSGIWLMCWGPLILIVEGMLLPKITIFNRLEILYPMTRLINNRPYWVKTILYGLIAIISIGVCAKWTSGVGGGVLIVLAFAYGLKQIDLRYRNKQQEFERTAVGHVPVWTITE